MEDETAALIGTDIGGYVVESELGRGGMGVVLAATHPMIGKRAAIKILKLSLSKNPATVERFLQEARSVNQIGHPNIVDIFAFGQLPDGRNYLVMDLLQGEPLRKRVKRGPVPVAEAVQLLEEIASALEAAHEKGFIHRDLKPDNVFLVANPTRTEVKLLDFGLAKLMPTAMIESDRAYRTATGAMIGTPDYMSPEQLRGTGVDHRTDIYALGVMAFEMLKHQRPHRFADGSFDLEGLTFKQALLAVRGVPEELADLIEAMIDRNPDQRPTLKAVRAVLKRTRPSAQSPAIGGVRKVATEASLDAFAASDLGAKPVLQTPPTGAPTVDQGPPSAAIARGPSTPPTDSVGPYSLGPQHSLLPTEALRVPTVPSPAPPAQPTTQNAPSWVGIKIPAEISSPGIRTPETSSPKVQAQPAPPQAPFQAPAPPPMAAPGLRGGGQAGLATKVGVAPPPIQNLRPHPVAAARRSESRTWLFFGFVLVVVATIILVVVLAT